MARSSVLDGCTHLAENEVADFPTELILDLKNQQDIIFLQECLSLGYQKIHALDPMMNRE